jgi:simple sugar transport system permease protein
LTLIMSGAFPVETPGGSTFFKFFGGGAYVTVYWALGVIVAMTILLNRTRWGLHTLATGGNLIGASESGVNVRRIKVGNFVLCSTLAALAGILESVRITSIQALQGGTQLMFYAVAAAVIGGTSLFGGSGTIIGAAIGVLVLAVLNLGFTLQGINAYTFDLVLGIAIIASMAFNVTLERIRQSGRLGTSR